MKLRIRGRADVRSASFILHHSDFILTLPMSTTFAYTATSKDGRKTSGTLAADNRSAAIALVVQQGMHPVSVNEARGGSASGNGGAATATLERPTSSKPAPTPPLAASHATTAQRAPAAPSAP